MNNVYKTMLFAFILTGMSHEARANSYGEVISFPKDLQISPRHNSTKDEFHPDGRPMKEKAFLSGEDFTLESIITSVPQNAVMHQYVKNGIGFYYWYGNVNLEYIQDGIANLYFDGNEVYYQFPVLEYWGDTYIKGTLNDNGSIVFNLPQPVSGYEYNGQEYLYYVSIMNMSVTDYGTITYVMPEEGEINQLVLKPSGLNDGSYVADDIEDETRILGITTFDFMWEGSGEYGISVDPFDYELITPPEGLEVQQYIIPWKTASAIMTHMVFDGDECYIQGISPIAPDGWVKGTKTDNGIQLNSRQYVGDNLTNNLFLRSRLFFNAAEIRDVWNEYYQDYIPKAVGIEEMTLTYDRETETYTSDKIIGTAYGSGDDMVFTSTFENPKLRFQPTDISLVPMTPIYKDYYPLSSQETAQCIHFIIPDLDVDGYLLDHNNLYYRILVNGTPFVWETGEYPSIQENLEWQHVDFDDFWDFMTHDDYISIVIYVEGMDTFGVQSSYLDGSIRYESDIMTFNVNEASISVADASEVVDSVIYYDLQGNKVINPDKGIFIKMVTYSNGTIKTSKIKF